VHLDGPITGRRHLAVVVDRDLNGSGGDEAVVELGDGRDRVAAGARQRQLGHIDGAGGVGIVDRLLADETLLDRYRLEARAVRAAGCLVQPLRGINGHLQIGDLLVPAVEEPEGKPVAPRPQHAHARRELRAAGQVPDQLAQASARWVREAGRLSRARWRLTDGGAAVVSPTAAPAQRDARRDDGEYDSVRFDEA
jgi:hypothetical protein